ncbi:MAG TPA: matrixin family metalloprotease [Candidatus Acidoferrales bacterium]|nr:matrixin family metalloprotease [Candidatus Acidoferrales bacterium]
MKRADRHDAGKRRLRRFVLAAALGTFLLVGFVASTSAFMCIKSSAGSHPCIHWSTGQARMKSFLGSPGRTLLNGTTTWDQNAVNAANDWNALGNTFHFDVATGGSFFNPCGSQGGNHACDNTGPNGDNPIFFAADFCGNGFGDIIELTNNCYSPDSGAMINAPVFVNSNVLWNAYDGAIQVDINNVVVYDIRRVLLHELGHVLGLDHPDDYGQHVNAIMNSHVSNLDRLQPDDINGMFSIYPSGGSSSQSPAPTSGCEMTTPASSPPMVFMLAAVFVVVRFKKRSNTEH